MAYRFKRKEAVADGVQRLVRSQTARALEALESATGDEQLESVFECRKRCKKVRAVTRLVRPLLDSEYDEVSRCYSEAGRLLATYRDPHAQLAAFDLLMAEPTGPAMQMAAIRSVLAKRADVNAEQLARDEDLLGRVDELLRVGRLRLDRWQIDATGWDAIKPGLIRNYKQCVEALELATAEPTPFNVHEFRKYAKYLRNHVRLIEPSSPTELGNLVADLKELTTTLGHANDLSELVALLTADPPAPLLDVDLGPTIAAISERQHRLERDGLASAGELFELSPKKMNARLGAGWKTWRG